jgi:hypothetical protein
MSGAGQIIKILYCEAKCTNTHDSGMIQDAHDKAGSSKYTSLLQLTELLALRNDSESFRWVNALRTLRLKTNSADRYDMVSYLCGQRPIRSETWIPYDRPHTEYKGDRSLQVFEVHLHEVDQLVKIVYNKNDD